MYQPPELDDLIKMLHQGTPLLSALELTLYTEDLGTAVSNLDDAFRSILTRPES